MTFEVICERTSAEDEIIQLKKRVKKLDAKITNWCTWLVVALIINFFFWGVALAHTWHDLDQKIDNLEFGIEEVRYE